MKKVSKKNKRKTRRNKKKNLRGGSNDVGFIVTRCVKKEEHNILYQDCYAAIRKFHPNLKIVFIDDNSDKNILKEIPMENVEIIQSEYPAAGEFLPYYYLYTRSLFKKAIILQDSMILTRNPIPYENVDDFMFLFGHTDPVNTSDFKKADIPMYSLVKTTKIPEELEELYYKDNWYRCWGTCMVITYDFLKEMEERVGIMQWKNIINSRSLRISLENAMGLICSYLRPTKSSYSLFGDLRNTEVVKQYGNEGYKITNYMNDRQKVKDGKMPDNFFGSFVKVWNIR